MVNSANKTRTDVESTYKTNRLQGQNKERELEVLADKANKFADTHADMRTNGTAEMDSEIQRLREQASDNVHQVLEREKAESLQAQDKHTKTGDTAAKDLGSALHNKTLQSNVGQAVVEVMGGRAHEAIKIAFQDEADFHSRINQNSAQDKQNLDNTTRHTDKVVSASLQRLKSIL